MSGRIIEIAHAVLVGPEFAVVEIVREGKDRQFMLSPRHEEQPKKLISGPPILMQMCESFDSFRHRRAQFIKELAGVGASYGMKKPTKQDHERWHRREGEAWIKG